MNRAALAVAFLINATAAALPQTLTNEQKDLITGAAAMAMVDTHCQATLEVDMKKLAAILVLGGLDANTRQFQSEYNARLRTYNSQITPRTRGSFCKMMESRYADGDFLKRK